jgi:hypothetical protein
MRPKAEAMRNAEQQSTMVFQKEIGKRLHVSVLVFDATGSVDPQRQENLSEYTA